LIAPVRLDRKMLNHYRPMRIFPSLLLLAALSFFTLECGRDNSNSPASSTPAGQQPASGLGNGGNQTGANTGVQGKTATGAGAGAVGGVRGSASNTGTNEDARDSRKANGSGGARRP
jgi:hypothetical protein